MLRVSVPKYVPGGLLAGYSRLAAHFHSHFPLGVDAPLTYSTAYYSIHCTLVSTDQGLGESRYYFYSKNYWTYVALILITIFRSGEILSTSNDEILKRY